MWKGVCVVRKTVSNPPQYQSLDCAQRKLGAPIKKNSTYKPSPIHTLSKDTKDSASEYTIWVYFGNNQRVSSSVFQRSPVIIVVGCAVAIWQKLSWFCNQQFLDKSIQFSHYLLLWLPASFASPVLRICPGSLSTPGQRAPWGPFWCPSSPPPGCLWGPGPGSQGPSSGTSIGPPAPWSPRRTNQRRKEATVSKGFSRIREK